MEIWKAIKGYEGFYEASNKGRVRSLDRFVPTARGGRNLKGVVLQPAIDNWGYPHVSMRIDGKSRTFKIHRLIALTFIGDCDKMDQVNHKNGIKTDNKVENLEWCTASFNVQHSYDTGLNKGCSGEINGKTTLSEEEVISIYKLTQNTKYSQRIIAEMYNTSRSTVGKIKLKMTWKYLLNGL